MISSIGSSSPGWQPAAPAGKAVLGAAREAETPDSPDTFKRDFYADLDRIVHNPTVIDAAVQISDEAFAAMREDPAYRQQMLELVQRDLGSSYAPRPASVMIRIGRTAADYRADSWPAGYDGEFRSRIQAAEKSDRGHYLWQKQKEFRTRCRPPQLAMQAGARNCAAHSAWLRELPGPEAPRALETYRQNSTASVSEGLPLWEMPGTEA